MSVFTQGQQAGAEVPPPDPCQELSQALRQATPSVDERLLVAESITAHAHQIARELEASFPEGDEHVLREWERLGDESNRRMTAGTNALSQLINDSQEAASHERSLSAEFIHLAHMVSTTLQQLSQALSDLSSLQEDIVRCREERDEIIRGSATELQEQFASSRATSSQIGGKRPQEHHQKNPGPSTIAKEAHILAEAQARYHLLNQQRQRQLNQGRIVFFVTIALLSLGVLLVFAGVVGIYLFNLAAGTITTVSGVLVNLISVIVLLFNKRENDRLDVITRELSTLDRMTVAMQYICQISDAGKRDQAISNLARHLVETRR
jgi:hypothetical protein